MLSFVNLFILRINASRTCKIKIWLPRRREELSSLSGCSSVTTDKQPIASQVSNYNETNPPFWS